MNRRLLPILLLAAARAAADGVPAALLDGVWVEHLRSRIEASEGSDRRVERYARDLLRVKPDDAPTLLALADCLHRQDKRDLAVALARHAHNAHPSDPRISALYDRLNNLRAPAGAPVASPVQIETLADSVRESAIRGDIDGLRSAEDQLAALLTRVRATEGHLDALASAYRELDEPALESALLAELLRRDPGRLDDLRRLAILLKRADAGRVLLPALRAMAGTASVPGFDRAAGAALTEVGAHAEAARHYNLWAESDPKNGAAWTALGIALFESGDVVRARAVLVKASALTDNLRPVYTTLARIAAEQRDPDDALIWLRRLLPLLSEQELSALLMQPGFSNIPEVLYQLR